MMNIKLNVFLVLIPLFISVTGCNNDDGTAVDVDNNNDLDIDNTDFDYVPPVKESSLKLLSPENESVNITSEDTIFMWNDSFNSIDIRPSIGYGLYIDEDLEKIKASVLETRRGGEYFYHPYEERVNEGYTPSSYDDDGYYQLVQFVISDMSFLEPNKKYYWKVSAGAYIETARFYQSSVGEFTTGGF